MQLTTIARPSALPAPNAEPVILLHGLLGRARNLGGLQRAAAEQADTFAPDLRNHGDSPHGPASYAAMAGDVLEMMDHNNIARARLVGHSMGGKVAMHLALTNPDRVSRLLVADIPPAKTGHGQDALLANMSKLAFPAPLDRATALPLLLPIAGSKNVAELLLQNIRLSPRPGEPESPQPPGWAIGIDELLAGIDAIQGWDDPQAPPNSCPTLFIRGANSPYIRPEHHAKIHELFPNAAIETIEDAGHWVHVEQPAAFRAAMMHFVFG